MLKKTVRFSGQTYEVMLNNNHEISKSVEGLDDSFLINLERVRNCANGVPIVKDDSGTELRLGWHFFRQTEKDMYNNYRKGLSTSTTTTTVSKKTSSVPVEFAKEVLKLKKDLSQEAVKFFEDIVKEAEEDRLKKLEVAVRALVAAGFDEETAKKIVESKQK